MNMVRTAWAAIGLLGVAVCGMFGAFFYLGARIDSLGARLDARIDGLTARIAALAARMDGFGERLEAHIERHLG